MADKIVVMHDGRVEQVGAPLDLYDRPANLFVAGFIGSPAMNFITGTLQARGGPSLLLDNGTSINVSGIPANSEGRRVVFGIRPEDLRIDPIRGAREIGSRRADRGRDLLGSRFRRRADHLPVARARLLQGGRYRQPCVRQPGGALLRIGNRTASLMDCVRPRPNSRCRCCDRCDAEARPRRAGTMVTNHPSDAGRGHRMLRDLVALSSRRRATAVGDSTAKANAGGTRASNQHRGGRIRN